MAVGNTPCSPGDVEVSGWTSFDEGCSSSVRARFSGVGERGPTDPFRFAPVPPDWVSVAKEESVKPSRGSPGDPFGRPSWRMMSCAIRDFRALSGLQPLVLPAADAGGVDAPIGGADDIAGTALGVIAAADAVAGVVDAPDATAPGADAPTDVGCCDGGGHALHTYRSWPSGPRKAVGAEGSAGLYHCRVPGVFAGCEIPEAVEDGFDIGGAAGVGAAAMVGLVGAGAGVQWRECWTRRPGLSSVARL